MNERIIWLALLGFALMIFMPKGHALTKQEIKEELYAQPFDFEQIKQDSKMFNDIFRERKRRFQFVEIDRYPTREQRKWYYILNSIDVGMTIWALNNRDNIKEGNIFLSNNPIEHSKQINDNTYISKYE